MVEMDGREIEELLGSARIGRLAMADAAGRPYAIPLPFCWLDGSVYLRLPMTGRKGEVLRQNPQVCFEADTMSESLDAYASVLVEGRLAGVTDVDEKLRVREANERKYRQLRGGHRPGHGRQTPIEQVAMQKVVVEKVSGRRKA